MRIRKQTEHSLYVSLELSGTFYTSEPWPGFLHKHVFWEIIYMAEGNGIIQIEDEPYSLNTGQAILVCPKEIHTFITHTNGAGIVYVGFQFEAGHGYAIGDSLSRMVFEYPIELSCLESVLKHIYAERSSADVTEDLIVALFPILKLIRNQSKASEADDQDQRKQLCSKTMAYIYNNTDRFVTVREIADSLYVTPHYLGITFASCMGQTVLQYQKQVKMERAASLIRQGRQTLVQISDQLGFSSPQYFSKCFQAYYGSPPSKLKTFLQNDQTKTTD